MQSSSNSVLRTALLAGPVSSAYYAAITILVPTRWPDYNAWSQTISELSAIEAPSRSLWVALAWPYTFLTLFFSWGVLHAAGPRRPVRAIGLLLMVYGAFGLVWPFTPMHLREIIAAGGGTMSDTMHIVLGLFTVALMLAAVALGTRIWSTRFRAYSWLTLLVVFVAGALTGLEAPGISTNQPTPWIGLWERVSLGAFLVWLSILAIRLLSDVRNAGSKTLLGAHHP